MIDIIKPTKISTPHIDALHGHTTIELKNVKNGKRERIESDNVVTTGPEDFWNSRGIYNNEVFTSLYTEIFGGLLLFDGTISTSSKYKPAGINMVGNGAYDVTNSSLVSEFGTYNAPESSKSSNSFTHVWDFLTSQANGTIASVCLCNVNGGYIGYGNKTSGLAMNNKRSLVYNIGDRRYNFTRAYKGIGVSTSWQCLFKNTLWSAPNIEGNATEINIYARSCPIDKVEYPTMPPMTDEDYIKSTISCTAPGTSLYSMFGDHTLYLVPANVASGATAPFYSVNLDTLVLTEGTFHNTAEQTMFVYRSDRYEKNGIVMDSDTKIVMFGGDNYLYLLNISNGTITNMNIEMGENNNLSLMRITPTLIGRPTSFNGGYGNWEDMYFCDISDPAWLPANGYISNIISQSYSKTVLSEYSNVNGLLLTSDYYSGAHEWSKAVPNLLRLNTINNLSDAVTKTAMQTMKVTYTITAE